MLQNLVINRLGSPKILLTDDGTEFINNQMKALATKIGFRNMTTPPYRPQADPVEQVNREIRTMIIGFIENSHREPKSPYPPEKPDWWTKEDSDRLDQKMDYRPRRRGFFEKKHEEGPKARPNSKSNHPEEPTCFIRSGKEKPTAHRSRVHNSATETSRTIQRLCWNCHKSGHTFSTCPEKRAKFCQMCGRRGYTARTYPSCGPEWKAIGTYVPRFGTNVPRSQHPYRRHR